MSDLNTMLLEHAKAGLQTQLDAAVTNGDTVAAKKVADEMAKLTIATAPKPSASYGGTEVVTALEAKVAWYGIDPKKSEAAVRLGKNMSFKKFTTADAFADAVIKAVDEEFKKPDATAENPDDAEDSEDPDDAEDPENEESERKPKKLKRSDGPEELGANTRSNRASTTPWTKLADAPPNIRKDVNRQADKFAPKDEKGRADFIKRALGSHYTGHMRKQGKSK